MIGRDVADPPFLSPSPEDSQRYARPSDSCGRGSSDKRPDVHPSARHTRYRDACRFRFSTSGKGELKSSGRHVEKWKGCASYLLSAVRQTGSCCLMGCSSSKDVRSIGENRPEELATCAAVSTEVRWSRVRGEPSLPSKRSTRPPLPSRELR